MGLLLALALTGITLVSMYFFAYAPDAWWLPPAISEYGEPYDKHFILTMWITGIIFFLSQFGLAYAVYRYRDRGQKATYSHGNPKLEVVWTVAAAVLFIGLVLGSNSIWVHAKLDAPPADALQVEVWGQQFAWYVRYKGPDGKFGRVVPEMMRESTGNPLGLDPADPAAADDLVMPVIAIPVNRPVEVILRSKDVIHNFGVRELRIKQDAVPGLENRLHFTASQIGVYEVPCMEICGLGHHQMRTYLQVKSEADFEQWLVESAEF